MSRNSYIPIREPAHQHSLPWMQGSLGGDWTPSPLRYPGGKTRALGFILPFIPHNTKSVASPFMGGGSIELACAAMGKQVMAYDIFSPLVQFWQCLLHNSDKLANRVEEYFPLSKQQFYALQKSHADMGDAWESAAVFFVLNRASFSGITLSGGMSPGHPRFTKSAISRLRNFYAANIQVEMLDYKDSIDCHNEDFLYLDPPYLNGQKLYGLKGSTHEGFDHHSLREMLHERKGWLLSYNDCATIRDWYKDYRIISADWRYGMGKSKTSQEILILSDDVRIPK